MARRLRGKQLAKHLRLTGSLAISGSGSTLPNSASLSIDGGINRSDSSNGHLLGNFDAGSFHDDLPTPSTKVVIP